MSTLDKLMVGWSLSPDIDASEINDLNNFKFNLALKLNNCGLLSFRIVRYILGMEFKFLADNITRYLDKNPTDGGSVLNKWKEFTKKNWSILDTTTNDKLNKLLKKRLNLKEIEKKEKPSTEQMSISELKDSMNEFIDQLEKYPDDLTFELIEKMKAIKNRAKKILENQNTTKRERSDQQEIIKKYNEIKTGYAVLVELSNLKKDIKNVIRENEFPCLSLLKSYSKFKNLIEFSQSLKLINSPEEMVKKVDKEGWKRLRKIIFEASVEGRELVKQKKEIKWITGSKSSSLIGISRAAKTALTDKPALVPTGLLIKHHIVPLSGEVGYGSGRFGVNQKSLSGMCLIGLNVCFEYASSTSFTFNAKKEEEIIKDFIIPSKFLINNFQYASAFTELERLKIAILRLKLTGLYTSEIDQRVQQIKKEFSQQIVNANKNNSIWKEYAFLIGQDITNRNEFKAGHNNIYHAGEVVGVILNFYEEKLNGERRLIKQEQRIGVITEINEGRVQIKCDQDPTSRCVTSTDMIFKLSEKELKKELNEKSLTSLKTQEEIISILEPSCVSLAEQAIEALNEMATLEPWKSTDKEREMLDNPYPIVWGSFNLEPESYFQGVSGEKIVTGTPILGKDIQIAFTSKEHVEDLQKVLDEMLTPYQERVKVMSFDAGFYLTKALQIK